MDEREAIEAARKDPSRFDVLYLANFERVYAYVVRRVASRAEAEDVTSEVFHRALRSLQTFEHRGVPLIAWLYRIAANELADHARRVGREQSLDGIDTPAESESVEKRALLFRLVDSLPAAQRDVIVKRFAEERSISEVARMTGRTEGAVKQLQLRALEKLRAQLREGA